MNAKLISSIADVARSPLVTLSANALLVDIASVLSNTQISLVVVCDVDGIMVGVITKTNLIRHIGQCLGGTNATVAADVMTRDVTYYRPTDSLPDVLSMMEKRGYVHIPVVDNDCKPVGVINARDALQVLLKDETYEESLLRDYVMGIGYQ